MDVCVMDEIRLMVDRLTATGISQASVMVSIAVGVNWSMGVNLAIS